MDPAALNSFLDQFLAVADSGFGLIRGDVNYVLNALIVISIVLAGTQWALAGEAPMAPLFRKVLFVGFFAFLVNNWPAITTAINRSGAMLGLRAGGDGMSLADLHNPGRVAEVGIDLFGRTAALSEGMNILSDAFAMAVIWVAAVAVMLGFFVLALQLFVSLLVFKIGSLAAFVALPWGVFSGTAWVAERPLGWVAGCAVRLFVLGFVASVTIGFVDTLPAAFTLDAGGVLNVFLFGLTTLALAWFAPSLAGEVVQGQPSLSGSDAMRTAVATTFSSAGGVYLASSVWRTGMGVMVGGTRAVGAVGGYAAKAAGFGGGQSQDKGKGGARQINYAKMQPKVKNQGGKK